MDQDTCRICLKESNQIGIFETLARSGEDLVANLIIDLADVECASDDKMPTSICEACLEELERACAFRKLVRTSDSKLREAIGDDEDEEEIEVLVKEQDEEEVLEVKYSLTIQPVKPRKAATIHNVPMVSAPDPQIIDEINIKPDYQDEGDEPMEQEEIVDDVLSDNTIEEYDSTEDASEVVPEWVMQKKQKIQKEAVTQPFRDHKNCCCSCAKTFESEEEVIVHAQLEHKVVPTNTQTGDEADISAESKTVKCKVCLKEFRSLAAMRSHRLRFTAVKQCTTCGTLVAKKRYNVHMRTHDNDPVECDICGLKLKSQRMLIPHRKSHEINGHFKCQECSKDFVNELAYQRHVNHHRYRKKPFRYQCEQCNKGFRSPGQLRNHMRVHTGEKPYTCEFCDQSFTHKTDHRRHMWSHTGSPYVCKGCGKDFQRPSHLRHHEAICVRMEEQENIEGNVEILFYECGDCNEQFATEVAFAEHIANHV